MDQKGYVMSVTSFLLIIPALLISLSVLNLYHEENNINCESIQSDIVLNSFNDIKSNIPQLTREVLENTSEEIIENNKTITNSPETLKKLLQLKIDNLTKNYQNNSNLTITCYIKSINCNDNDPFYIEVNSSLTVNQRNITHQEQLSNLVSIEGLKDPMPFVQCRSFGYITHNKTRIIYENALYAYLNHKGVNNAIYYQNASSPLIIKKCPYDPYINHGQPNILKNCLENGFYHESMDGSCYMCRLEGKGYCPHYGMEIFILPGPLCNASNLINSSNLTVITAPCSSDHVIFGYDTYPGDIVKYHAENGTNYFLFLENGHQSKYGLI